MNSLKINIWLSCIISLLITACGSPNRFDISSIQDASKLAALEVKLDKTLFANKQKKLFGFFFGGISLGNISYIVETEATLLIGIDAAKITEKDVDVSLGEISITLPPIELLDFSYPAESFVENPLYTDGSKFKLEEKEEVYMQGELEIRAMLPYLKLEERAQEKVKLIMRPILADMGFETIKIDFHPSTDFNQPAN